MNSVQNFFARPGVQSSEFKVAVAIATWLGVNADQHWVSVIQSLIVAASGIAYIISRGFAKVEPRGPTPQPTSPPAVTVPPVVTPGQ